MNDRAKQLAMDLDRFLEGLARPGQRQPYMGRPPSMRDILDALAEESEGEDADLDPWASLPGHEIDLMPGRGLQVPPDVTDAAAALVPEPVMARYGKVTALYRYNSDMRTVTGNAWTSSKGYPAAVTANPCDGSGSTVNTAQTLYLRLPPRTARQLAVGDVLSYLPTDRKENLWTSPSTQKCHGVVLNAPADGGLPVLDDTLEWVADGGLIMIWPSGTEPDTLFGYTTGWLLTTGQEGGPDTRGRALVGYDGDSTAGRFVTASLGALGGGVVAHDHTGVTGDTGGTTLVGAGSDVQVVTSHHHDITGEDVIPPGWVTHFIWWNGLGL